ncbi:unnamed protein product [Medioppia subpectinata]|uniref:Uncharacterized protein n=1 Tax=Medioppia subpectinata TaxID=1979941 RepID=A0A7R9KUH9_9ACAR|nr:unnamed protein product [Medioppia subpectinata]CAG2109949.1 unnamed protein product [Medioppia subpectinata]
MATTAIPPMVLTITSTSSPDSQSLDNTCDDDSDTDIEIVDTIPAMLEMRYGLCNHIPVRQKPRARVMSEPMAIALSAIPLKQRDSSAAVLLVSDTSADIPDDPTLELDLHAARSPPNRHAVV